MAGLTVNTQVIVLIDTIYPLLYVYMSISIFVFLRVQFHLSL